MAWPELGTRLVRMRAGNCVNSRVIHRYEERWRHSPAPTDGDDNMYRNSMLVSAFVLAAALAVAFSFQAHACSSKSTHPSPSIHRDITEGKPDKIAPRPDVGASGNARKAAPHEKAKKVDPTGLAQC